MPNDRLDERCDDICATLDRCIRIADQCIWRLWVILALTLILCVKVFFYA